MNCRVYLICEGQETPAQWYYHSIGQPGFIRISEAKWKRKPKAEVPCCDKCKAEIERRIQQSA